MIKRSLLVIFAVLLSQGALLLQGYALGAQPHVAAGYFHVAALTEDGQVLGWGANQYFQLGNGEGVSSSNGTPLALEGFPDNVVALSSGSDHILALDGDSQVWAIGRNTSGQLGIGLEDVDVAAEPVLIENFDDVLAISTLSAHSLALKSDGTVWAWGYNNKGQLGVGDADNAEEQLSPVHSPGFEDIIAIAAGGAHSLALKSDGSVWATGSNTWGAVGDGSGENQFSAVQVSGLSDIVLIDAGSSHSLALKSDGTVWAWGSNAFGQLGDGTKVDRTTPVRVSGLTDVKRISVSYNASYALKFDGSLYAWGANLSDGIMPIQVADVADTEVSDDSSDDSNSENVQEFEPRITLPTLVQIPEEFADLNIISVTGGNNQTFVQTYEGQILSWGSNIGGALGKVSTEENNDSIRTIGEVVSIDGENAMDLGQVTITEPQPLYGTLSWGGDQVSSTTTLFSGGVRNATTENYKPLLAANELFDLNVEMSPESSHVGQEADIFIVMVIVGVGAYQLDLEGNMISWDGLLENLSPAFQRTLQAGEQILVEDLQGSSLGLSGQQIQVYTGYSLTADSVEVYLHTSPITFRVQ